MHSCFFKADEIYRRPTNLSSGWQHLDGRLKFVSTHDGNVLWGANAADQIFTAKQIA